MLVSAKLAIGTFSSNTICSCSDNFDIDVGKSLASYSDNDPENDMDTKY